MSDYSSNKPFRLLPADFPKWRFGEGAKISTCHYCICQRCTGSKCRIKHRMDRCMKCIQDNDKMPVMYCDDWTVKPYKMLKVEKKHTRYQELVNILNSMDVRLKKIEESNKDEL